MRLMAVERRWAGNAGGGGNERAGTKDITAGVPVVARIDERRDSRFRTVARAEGSARGKSPQGDGVANVSSGARRRKRTNRWRECDHLRRTLRGPQNRRWSGRWPGRRTEARSHSRKRAVGAGDEVSAKPDSGNQDAVCRPVGVCEGSERWGGPDGGDAEVAGRQRQQGAITNAGKVAGHSGFGGLERYAGD